MLLTLILSVVASIALWSLPHVERTDPAPLWFRVVACAIVTHRAIVVLLFSEPITVELKYLKGSKFKDRAVVLQKWSRLRTFTVQSWCLQGLYFAYPTPHLQAVVFATAHLVSAVTSFVLIPMANQKNHFLFSANALWMHNANTILAHLDLLFRPIDARLVGAPVLWAIWYVLFAWIAAYFTGWIPYNFLDYSIPYAIPFHLGLCLALVLFFFVGVGLASLPHAWIAQLLLVRVVTRFRL